MKNKKITEAGCDANAVLWAMPCAPLGVGGKEEVVY